MGEQIQSGSVARLGYQEFPEGCNVIEDAPFRLSPRTLVIAPPITSHAEIEVV